MVKDLVDSGEQAPQFGIQDHAAGFVRKFQWGGIETWEC
jgi:hypothetical protein